jgi:hypothetical protein
MRYIILAVIIYILYLFLKYIIRVYLSSPGNDPGVKGKMNKKKHSKIDFNKIEEADYEEIKTPKQDK